MAHAMFRAKLCHAVDMVQQLVEYYRNTAQSCSQDQGADVYAMFRNEEQDLLSRLKELQAGLADPERKGAKADARCEPAQPGDGRALFRRIAERFAPHGGETCVSAMEVIQSALDLETELVRSIETWVAEAKPADEVESHFFGRMLELERAHRLTLTDMHAYYSDPEEWALGSGRQGPDEK